MVIPFLGTVLGNADEQNKYGSILHAGELEMIQECTVVRQERILKCPECNEEFNTGDIEGETEMQAGGYDYTLIECPRCKEIVAIEIKESK
jgi:phage FluMu protein Com